MRRTLSILAMLALAAVTMGSDTTPHSLSSAGFGVSGALVPVRQTNGNDNIYEYCETYPNLTAYCTYYLLYSDTRTSNTLNYKVEWESNAPAQSLQACFNVTATAMLNGDSSDAAASGATLTTDTYLGNDTQVIRHIAPDASVVIRTASGTACTSACQGSPVRLAIKVVRSGTKCDTPLGVDVPIRIVKVSTW